MVKSHAKKTVYLTTNCHVNIHRNIVVTAANSARILNQKRTKRRGKTEESQKETGKGTSEDVIEKDAKTKPTKVSYAFIFKLSSLNIILCVDSFVQK